MMLKFIIFLVNIKRAKLCFLWSQQLTGISKLKQVARVLTVRAPALTPPAPQAQDLTGAMRALHPTKPLTGALWTLCWAPRCIPLHHGLAGRTMQLYLWRWRLTQGDPRHCCLGHHETDQNHVTLMLSGQCKCVCVLSSVCVCVCMFTAPGKVPKIEKYPKSHWNQRQLENECESQLLFIYLIYENLLAI